MAFKEVTIEELAKSLDIDVNEAREKQKLAKAIVKKRTEKGWSQTRLAKIMGLSQSRIAQIESGLQTSKITFDILLQVLTVLGCDFKIVLKKEAA